MCRPLGLGAVQLCPVADATGSGFFALRAIRSFARQAIATVDEPTSSCDLVAAVARQEAKNAVHVVPDCLLSTNSALNFPLAVRRAGAEEAAHDFVGSGSREAVDGDDLADSEEWI